MMLERCSFSKITITTWSGRGTTALFLPAFGCKVSELRGLAAVPLAEVCGAVDVAADRGSVAVQAVTPLSKIMAREQATHRRKPAKRTPL